MDDATMIVKHTAEESMRSKIVTKSSECISLPTEHAPNFLGWKNLEVNHDHSLNKDAAKNKKRYNIKNRLTQGVLSQKYREQPTSIFSQLSPKDFSGKIQTPKKYTNHKSRRQPITIAAGLHHVKLHN